ncbi:MAG: universal stress protein [Burkholderiales bacterium]|nr:universal stress protein [Burkholderiales bacterium]
MTIVVAYVARPEGQAALNKGIEIAKRRKERLLVVNASPGGGKDDPSMLDGQDYERVNRLLDDAAIDAEIKQFVRGKSAVEGIENLVVYSNASLLIIGLRKRSAIGKLIMGSVAQELLLSISCPILAVKAGGT